MYLEKILFILKKLEDEKREHDYINIPLIWMLHNTTELLSNSQEEKFYKFIFIIFIKFIAVAEGRTREGTGLSVALLVIFCFEELICSSFFSFLIVSNNLCAGRFLGSSGSSYSISSSDSSLLKLTFFFFFPFPSSLFAGF